MKRSCFLTVVLTFVFMFTIGTNIVVAKSLLDDFSGDYLDSTKWNNQDIVRAVVNQQLVSKLNTTSGDGGNWTTFANSDSIYAIQADVTVVNTSLGNDPDVSAQARIDGTFFNSQGSGGVIGDLWVALRLQERGTGLEVSYTIYEALDDNWDTMTHWAGDTIATGLEYGTTYTLKIEYDQGNHEFTFSIDGFAPATITSNDLPAYGRAAVNPGKSLATRIFNAVSGTNFIHALFDNVYINNDMGTVYDDFSTAPLDQGNWQSKEIVRETSGGKLQLNIHAEDERNSATINPINQETNYLEAKILIESGSQLNPGTSGFARIGGYYYNESRGPGSGKDYDGEIGDAWVTSRIVLDDSNNLRAYSSVWVSDKPDGWDSKADSLFYQEYAQVQFDTEYTLSIEYTGTGFIFKLNDETYQYDIVTPQYPPAYGQYRQLQSRVYADPGESGQIKVQFDDVYIGTVKVTFDDSSSNGGGGCFISTIKK